jgi:hypothetical protein
MRGDGANVYLIRDRLSDSNRKGEGAQTTATDKKPEDNSETISIGGHWPNQGPEIVPK